MCMYGTYFIDSSDTTAPFEIYLFIVFKFNEHI